MRQEAEEVAEHITFRVSVEATYDDMEWKSVSPACNSRIEVREELRFVNYEYIRSR
jgi:hypothetical protein